MRDMEVAIRECSPRRIAVISWWRDQDILANASSLFSGKEGVNTFIDDCRYRFQRTLAML